MCGVCHTIFQQCYIAQCVNSVGQLMVLPLERSLAYTDATVLLVSAIATVLSSVTPAGSPLPVPLAGSTTVLPDVDPTPPPITSPPAIVSTALSVPTSPAGRSRAKRFSVAACVFSSLCDRLSTALNCPACVSFTSAMTASRSAATWPSSGVVDVVVVEVEVAGDSLSVKELVAAVVRPAVGAATWTPAVVAVVDMVLIVG